MITSYGEYIKLAVDDEGTKQVKPSLGQTYLDSALVSGGSLGGAILAYMPQRKLIDSVAKTNLPEELIGDESKIKKLMRAHKLEGKTPLVLDSQLKPIESAFVGKDGLKLMGKLDRWANKGRVNPAPLRTGVKNLDSATKFIRNSKRPDLWQKHGVVVTSRTPDLDILSHELGHAGGKLVNSKTGVLLRALNTRAPILTGFGTYARTLNNLENPDNANNTGANVITAAGAIPAVSTLGEEARASLVGLKRLKEMGLSPEALKVARGRLGKAFGTYALSAAGMHGGANLVGYLAAKRRHKILEKKRAEAEAQK
jgi:hypothetical protein